jgi:chromate transport protein ChrA
MAKKKKKVPVKKKEVKLATESVGSVEHTAYVLGLVASIIIIVAAILFLVFPANFGVKFELFPRVTNLLGLLNLVAGVAMLITTFSMKANPREASVLILVFSIIALLFPPHGMIIGAVLGIFGAILILIKIK